MCTRYLFLIIVYLTFFSAYKGVADPYTIYEKEDFSPASDDPWKGHPIKILSPKFKKQLYEENKTHYLNEDEFHESINMNTEMSAEKHKIKKMGNFVFRTTLRIGSGEEGGVYLAQHIPSGVYAAIKMTTFYGEAENQPEYLALKNLERLYGCYVEDTTMSLCMPLVTGRNAVPYQSPYASQERIKTLLGVTLTEKKEITYDNWDLNVHLMQTYLDEFEYCSRKGTWSDGAAQNILVTEDSQIVFVDQKACRPTPPETRVMHESLCFFHYFLGLIPFRKKGGKRFELREDIKFPPPIRAFNKIVVDSMNASDPIYTLAQIKEAFSKFKIDMKAYFLELSHSQIQLGSGSTPSISSSSCSSSS